MTTSVARKAGRERERVEHLAALFGALSDPNRLRLMRLLLDGERCVHELSTALGLEQSAVSHQLRLLRDRRLVRRRKEGRHAWYALDDAHVEALLTFALEHVQHERRSSASLGGRRR
jgi:DNA-binding transcriptional ArsR family regulator